MKPKTHNGDDKPRRPFQRKPDFETPWARAWRRSPERMREHVTRMTEARTAKAEERASLIQALFDMMPSEPMRPYVLRDRLVELWSTAYGEELTLAKAWLEIRCAIRQGLVGRTDDGDYIPRHSTERG
jgi:hypothetical protein